MKTPLLLDTKRMAVHDGPGIRTAFFVKGCPLKCPWCHNPEAISPERQIARFRHLCTGHTPCTMDEMTCPTRAFKVYGKEWTIEQIVDKACEDKAFYDASGGGVTISGGEPLLYFEWLEVLLKALKSKDLHTAVDTTLYAAPSAIENLVPLVDIWLVDYKAHDSSLHQRLTGVPNEPIKRNLEWLVAQKAQIEIRIPVVPGCNDSEENLQESESYLHGIGIDKIVRLEYHDLARSKYLALGMEDTMPPLPAKDN